jgi:hypothetical protein
MKIYLIVKETYDHTIPAPAGCFSYDGDLVSREVVKAFFSKEKCDAEFKRSDYTTKYDGDPNALDEGKVLGTYDKSEEFSKEEFEMSEEYPAKADKNNE